MACLDRSSDECSGLLGPLYWAEWQMSNTLRLYGVKALSGGGMSAGSTAGRKNESLAGAVNGWLHNAPPLFQ